MKTILTTMLQTTDIRSDCLAIPPASTPDDNDRYVGRDHDDELKIGKLMREELC